MMKKIDALRKRIAEGEEGFTLIELIIVIAIIGILVAIAIPVYGTIQQNARNNAASANASNGLAMVMAAQADGGTAPNATSMNGSGTPATGGTLAPIRSELPAGQSIVGSVSGNTVTVTVSGTGITPAGGVVKRATF